MLQSIFKYLNAIHVRHFKISNNNIIACLIYRINSLATIFYRGAVIAFVLKYNSQGFPDTVFVICN